MIISHTKLKPGDMFYHYEETIDITYGEAKRYSSCTRYLIAKVARDTRVDFFPITMVVCSHYFEWNDEKVELQKTFKFEGDEEVELCLS